MKTFNGVIDQNDLEYVNKMASAKPLYAIPAPYAKNKDGSYKQINPHESRFILENGKMASVFHIKPIYVPTPQGQWRPLYEVASYYGNKRGMTLKDGWEKKMDFGYLAWYIKRLEAMKSQYGVAVNYPQTYAGIELTPVQIPVLLNANITVYPNPHAETTTVDGYASDEGNDKIWSDLLDEPGTNVSDDGTYSSCVYISASTTSGQWSALYRGICLFNISSISGSTISSAIMSLYGQYKGENFSPAITPDINIYSSAPASNTVLAAGDFDSLGSTAFCDTPVTYNGWSIVGYNAFAFNVAGVAFVQTALDSVNGIVKLGTRNASYEVAGSPPVWTSAGWATMKCYFADQSLTTYDPKLYVEYTAATAGGFLSPQKGYW